MLKQPLYKKSKIQDFGYLICTDSSGIITGISTNITDILPQQFDYYLEKPFATISRTIFVEWEDKILEAIQAIEETHYIRKIIDIQIDHEPYYLSLYKEGRSIYYEIEKKTTNSMTHLALNDLSSLLSAPSEQLWQNLSNNICKILGLHKTIIFKINNDQTGTVCAQTINGDYKSSMGLHFAEEFISDDIIDFYKQSTSRFCYDINKLNSHLCTTHSSDVKHQHTQQAPFPCTHLTYLKEIGVKTALVYPIIINNKCWGLLIGTHYETKWMDLHLRQVGCLMVQYASNAFGSSMKHNLLKFHKKIKEFELDLKGQLLVDNDINTTLAHNIKTLCEVVHADGIAIVQQEDHTYYGLCPSEHQLTQILNTIKTHKDKRVFKDHNFSLKRKSMIEGQLPFAGIMSLRLNKSSDHYIFWFRKETAKEIINIAHTPENITLSKGSSNLTKNPKIWNNIISKSSIPWNASDLYLVNRLYNLVQEIKIKKSEEQEKVNHELISLNNELEMLTFTLSHDIKNPLSIVKLGSQMLQLNAKMTKDEVYKWSKTIQEATQSIENLVDSSLVFTQAKSYIFKKIDIQITPIIRKVINESRLMYEKNSCEFVCGNLLPLYGERNLLYQVFLNIIGNAIKYSANKEFPKIEIYSYMDDNHVIYNIQDNGIGIPESDLLTIFEIFKRSNNAKQFNGSGVGLALVKRILDRLDASAKIESIEDGGTLISLYFPKSPHMTPIN